MAEENTIDNTPPSGFTALFNGTDLIGWKGLVGNPKTRAKMTAADLASEQKKANESMREHGKVEDGALVFDAERYFASKTVTGHAIDTW